VWAYQPSIIAIPRLLTLEVLGTVEPTQLVFVLSLSNQLTVRPSIGLCSIPLTVRGALMRCGFEIVGTIVLMTWVEYCFAGDAPDVL